MRRMKNGSGAMGRERVFLQRTISDAIAARPTVLLWGKSLSLRGGKTKSGWKERRSKAHYRTASGLLGGIEDDSRDFAKGLQSRRAGHEKGRRARSRDGRVVPHAHSPQAPEGADA